MRGLRGKSGAGGEREQRGGKEGGGGFPFQKIHESYTEAKAKVVVYKADLKCAMCERLCEAQGTSSPQLFVVLDGMSSHLVNGLA